MGWEFWGLVGTPPKQGSSTPFTHPTLHLQVLRLEFNCLPSQIKNKKNHEPLRTSWISQTICWPCLKIITFSYFDFCMFLLYDLCFVLSLHDLQVLGVQRIMGFFILITRVCTVLKSPWIWLLGLKSPWIWLLVLKSPWIWLLVLKCPWIVTEVLEKSLNF